MREVTRSRAQGTVHSHTWTVVSRCQKRDGIVLAMLSSRFL